VRCIYIVIYEPRIASKINADARLQGIEDGETRCATNNLEEVLNVLMHNLRLEIPVGFDPKSNQKFWNREE
jgi:hypothetical protein